MEIVKANPINRGTYRGYDCFEEIDGFELDGYVVYKKQCEDSEGIKDLQEQGEEEGWTEEDINEACWDSEKIIVSIGWDNPTPRYVIDKALEYFNN